MKRIAALCMSALAICSVANAQSTAEIIQEIEAKGPAGISCRSVWALFRDPEMSPVLANAIAGWISGYVQGAGSALYVTMQDPMKSAIAESVQKSPQKKNLGIVLAAIATASLHGDMPIINGASWGTRRSQLSDYCQENPDKSLETAAGVLLVSTWLKLPTVVVEDAR